MGRSGALLALPLRLMSAVAAAVIVPLGAVAGGSGWPATVVPPWLSPAAPPESALQRPCRVHPRRRRRRCCSLVEEAHSSLRREITRGMLPAPAQEIVAAPARLAVVARPGGDRTLGGRGCQDHSGVGGKPAGWSFRKIRDGRRGGAPCLDLGAELLPRGGPADRFGRWRPW